MPTYEYVCTECGHRLEAVQSFSDKALTTCPVCQGVLRKVFGNVGIVLKGTGFYKTDSRRTGASNGSSGGAKEGKEKESVSSGESSNTADSGSKDSAAATTSSSSSGSSSSTSSGSGDKATASNT